MSVEIDGVNNIIKADTISEVTSANGVAVDSLGIKDGKVTNLMNATLSAADLGTGVHIKIADSGATATAHGDELVIEDGTSGANVGISILCNANGEARINFGDSDDNDIGMIRYDHADNKLHLIANNTSVITLTSAEIVMNDGSNDQDFRVESNGNANAIFVNGGTDSVTIGAADIVQTLAGIPFFSAGGNSIYTHDVSGTDDTAAQNAGYGFRALEAITTGDHNSAFGFGALLGNTTGGRNVAIGRVALEVADTENDNIAIGYNAMAGAVAGGEFNIAIGSEALDALTSGDSNTAIGYNAGSALTSPSGNTILGSGAAAAATTSEDNVVIGKDAASQATFTGDDNVVIGKDAGSDNTSAYNNVLVGKDAGKSISTGGGNVCIGKASGQDPGSTPITTGTDNIFIGNGTNTQASNGVNAIGIGTNFTVAANNFSFGKQSNVVSNVFTSDANWARSSDERLKTNITGVSWDSLDFINAIRPVTFTWKNSNAVPTDMDEYDANKNHMDTTTVIDGLIAQEVKTAMDAHNMTNFSGWKTNSLGTQTLSKEAFVIPLIKAIQELSAKVKALEEA